MEHTIPRLIEGEILQGLDKHKASLLLGARRVGKTVLIHQILEKCRKNALVLSGEDADALALLAEQSIANYRRLLSGYDLLVIDEAQNVPYVAAKAKLMIDHIEPLHIILTGSSAFDVAGFGEALTGRNFRYLLFPIAQAELKTQENALQTRQNLEERLIYGSYPELLKINSIPEKQDYLNSLCNDYLLRDLLAFEDVRKSAKVYDLLRLLAWQCGNEVSLEELGRSLGISKNTVERYLDLLTQVFIIYRRGGYSGNLRKEVTKSAKWYFYDNGIRNALIGQFQPLALRQDVGALWENYLLSERLKWKVYNRKSLNNYFWRTYDGQEIDLIEDEGGHLSAFEMKWQKQAVKVPAAFSGAYPQAAFQAVHRENYIDFIGA